MAVPSVSIYHRDYEQIRNLLRLIRLEAEFTQTQLAKRLGVGQSYVSKIERGESFVDLLIYVNWCEACGAVPGETLDRFLRKQ